MFEQVLAKAFEVNKQFQPAAEERNSITTPSNYNGFKRLHLISFISALNLAISDQYLSGNCPVFPMSFVLQD